MCANLFPYNPPLHGKAGTAWKKCCTDQTDNPERQKRTDKRLTSRGVVVLFYLNMFRLFIMFL